VTMRTIPIDLGKLAGFTLALLPEPYADRETGEARTDRATGLPIYLVGVNVSLPAEREAYALTIRVPGEPAGLQLNQVVRVHDLVAVPWDRDGRSGVTYRASAVTPASAPAPARPAGPALGSSGPDTAAGRATGGKGAGA
jgi:hypothetical protein